MGSEMSKIKRGLKLLPYTLALLVMLGIVWIGFDLLKLTERYFVDFNGPNNNFSYPDLPENVSTWDFSERNYNRLDLSYEINYERNLLYNTDYQPRWPLQIQFSHHYFEFGDYENALLEYEDIFGKSGLAHFDYITIKEFAALLISKGRIDEVIQIVNSEAAIYEYPGTRSEIQSVIYCRTGNYGIAFTSYCKYKLETILNRKLRW
jgi:hypothetical protein